MRKENFGKEVKRLRKMCAVTQEWLAAQIGVEKSYISKIETGNIGTMPSFETIDKIERALFVDGGYLVDLAGYYNSRKLDGALEQDPSLARTIRAMYEGS